jgi:excinuclease ABC subunit A
MFQSLNGRPWINNSCLKQKSIGLHQQDNERLIKSLKNLRDLKNTIIVVEHDKDIMLNADFIIDMGVLNE